MHIRQKYCLKYTDCAKLRKITITNCLMFFFQILQISLLFILFDLKKFKLTVQVSCLFYFLLLSRFFQRKISVFFLSGLFLKKKGVVVFYNNPAVKQSAC